MQELVILMEATDHNYLGLRYTEQLNIANDTRLHRKRKHPDNAYPIAKTTSFKGKRFRDPSGES